jgi:NhaP-type Na+/H+ or K+/H+ antiporter
VVGLHLSANVFNNVLLDEAKRALMMVGGGGLAVGVLLGWLLGRLLS